MPASETTDFEREFAELVSELRALSTAAPTELRERVRALGEPAPRRVIRWRRATLVLVPACAVAVVAAAAVHGILSSSHSTNLAAVETTQAAQRDSGGKEPGRLFSPLTVPGAQQAGVPAPNPGRYQDVQAYLRVRVKDLDALGKQTAAAMQLTQELGGYVERVDQSTSAGAPGEADLVLRVPVGHVQAALIRLSALGTVLEQHVSIRDLNRVVAAQRQRILRLKVEIARLTETLRGSLPADVRLRLQFQLDEAKRNLASATAAKGSTLRAAALSRVQLGLTTQHAVAPVTKHHRGRVGRAVHGALGFLTGAGAVALVALIVLSPVLVLAALSFWLIRAYRRREEQRLLAAP